jgi:hypothetical protein
LFFLASAARRLPSLFNPRLSLPFAGYTGTEVCVDPQRQLITILLTNRVYPKASDESEERIHHARQLFNNLVASLVDHGKEPQPSLVQPRH